MLSDQWWVWMSAALAMATLEVIVPGYIFLGFAAGAFFVGAMLLLGLTGMSLPVMLVIFAVLSLIAFLALRKVFGLKNGQVKIWDRDINE
ncbi:NfeD family protein [Yoonia sp. R2331]|uniref:NfeD family protein n=1 Tax=Yoonia sp. R2331 TaxID=3237238 RepID=UPI0034E3E49A